MFFVGDAVGHEVVINGGFVGTTYLSLGATVFTINFVGDGEGSNVGNTVGKLEETVIGFLVGN